VAEFPGAVPHIQSAGLKKQVPPSASRDGFERDWQLAVLAL
jgi:hypothetical protein